MTVEYFKSLGATDKEALIAERILKGDTNLEIAMALKITERTVKFHVTRIYKKFEVCSRAKLMAKFLTSGPVSLT
jgi:DNA-binding CsgD family transcriptional regulator